MLFANFACIYVYTLACTNNLEICCASTDAANTIPFSGFFSKLGISISCSLLVLTYTIFCNPFPQLKVCYKFSFISQYQQAFWFFFALKLEMKKQS